MSPILNFTGGFSQTAIIHENSVYPGDVKFYLFTFLTLTNLSSPSQICLAIERFFVDLFQQFPTLFVFKEMKNYDLFGF